MDRATGRVLYVGKALENRAFSHLDEASESERTTGIREILEAGRELKIESLAHGLETRKHAWRVEAAAIDVLGIGRSTSGALQVTVSRRRRDQVREVV